MSNPSSYSSDPLPKSVPEQYETGVHPPMYTPVPTAHHPYPVAVNMEQSTYWEGRRAASTATIHGLLALFVFAPLFGALALVYVKKAEGMGVPATAGKVMGWIALGIWGAGLLIFIVMILFSFIVTAGVSVSQ